MPDGKITGAKKTRTEQRQLQTACVEYTLYHSTYLQTDWVKIDGSARARHRLNFSHKGWSLDWEVGEK